MLTPAAGDLSQLFTSLPVIIMGVFEKDLAASTLLAVPELYVKGQQNGAFNLRLYFGWMVMASTQSVAVFYIIYRLYGTVAFTADNDLFPIGDLAFTSVVILISTKLQ